ncbi:uncharacterized protein BX663DRAFT_438342 [Cokeromyces recurvatus]|uniref:uncharacterized protein n=1 Tax=Cokeromyces recurvatus TaxID=90255 RepID=UPI00221EFF5A|nr:uncharacterized protein BX663DRAFT_438342 [Cokeromyces recurvatus]KAI7900868.1 hypothetical protein BX663DRAFT_438342 [Cokeromyces recurvatus]
MDTRIEQNNISNNHQDPQIIVKKRPQRKRRTYADDDDGVQTCNIGTQVKEGHPNYPMMYDMLTGIRIGVGRVSAKRLRPLKESDFTAAHKLVFDITGNELTPGVKYDFKFKDYAPWVFRHLREKFHVDSSDYMMSLTSKYILSEIGSPGKSGSFFYYSRDYRFIIKTIHHSEHKFMIKILKQYYEHVCNNSNTLLCRFYGLHRIKMPRGRKIHFVVMGNIMPPNKDIHQKYDLKGSLFGRYSHIDTEEDERSKVRKDQNWLQENQQLELGPIKRDLLLQQITIDVEFLKAHNIMDYSLFIGIHDLTKGNREGLKSLHMVSPSTTSRHSNDSAELVREAVKNSNYVQVNLSHLPAQPSEERLLCIFYADEGGFRSTDQNNQPSDKLYYFGIIDILTPYNFIKKSEHFWKRITQDKQTISAVPPIFYGNRFMTFMKKAIMNRFSNPTLNIKEV